MCLKAGGIILVAVLGFAQSQKTVAMPEFEVASVKPSSTNERMNYGQRPDGIFGTNMPAKGWIQIAYGIKDFQIVGPDWISFEKFDIDAKAGSLSSARQKLLMLQSLLADRFQLTLHRETRESSVYSLVVSRGGLKMKPSKDQTLWAGDYPDGSPDGRPLTGGGPRALAPGRFAGDAIPMTMFVNLLAGPLNRPVINKTGLTGRYDIDLHYAPGSGQAPPVETVESAQRDSSSEASLFTAIQEQLGLRLESTKGPVEMLIVDHIERPRAN
jgi:uncharacterized protein (TIGR03435 family)